MEKPMDDTHDIVYCIKSSKSEAPLLGRMVKAGYRQKMECSIHNRNEKAKSTSPIFLMNSSDNLTQLISHVIGSVVFTQMSMNC